MPRTDPKLTEKIREAARRLLADAPTATGWEIARAAGLTADQADDLRTALLSTTTSAEFQCFQVHADGEEQAFSFWDGYDDDLASIHYRLRLDENGRVPPSWAQFIKAESRAGGDGDGEPRVMGALEWRCSNCRAHSIRFERLKHHDLCYHGPLQVRRDMQPRLQELLAEHNKKAAKLGVGGGLKFRVIREFTVPEHVFVGTATAADPFGDVCKVPGCSPKGDPSHWLDAPYVEIQLDGEVPKLPGWSILGRIESTPGGNLVLEAPGQKIPTRYRTETSRCDHCNLKRNRTDTIVIQKDDKIMQVGRNCLRDFIGTPDAEEMVRMFLAFSAKWKEIMDRVREGGGSERGPRYEGISLRDLLQFTAASVRKAGFVSKAYAERSEFRRRPTADDVREAYMSVKFRGKQDEDPRTPADVATAATAAEWIGKMLAAPGEASTFDHNLAVLARGGWIPDGKEAFGVNLFEAWRKANGLSDPKEVKLNSYRDEGIGETITIRARVAMHKERATEGYNVFRDLYKLRDEQGRTLVLWTPSADQSKDGRRNPPDDGRPTVGAKVIVTLKIKSKKEYNDKLETQVTMVGDWAFDVGQDLDAPARERAEKLLEAQRLAKEERGEPEPTVKLKRLAPLPNPKTVREVLAEAWRRAAKLPWRAAPLKPTKTKGYQEWRWEGDAWTVVAEEMAAARYGLDDAFRLARLAEQPEIGASASQALQYLAHSDEERPRFSYGLRTMDGGDARSVIDEVIFAADEAGFPVNRNERSGWGRQGGLAASWEKARAERPLDPAMVGVLREWFDLLGGFEFGKTGKAELERPEKTVKVKRAVVDRADSSGASSRPVPKSPTSPSKPRTSKKTARPNTVGDLLKQAYVRSRALPWVAMRELAPVVETLERNAWTAVVRALGRKYNLDSELEHQVYPELQFLEGDDAVRAEYRHMDAGGRTAEIVVAAADAGFAVEKDLLRRAGRMIEESQSKERQPVTGNAPEWATRNMGLLHALFGKAKRKEARVVTKEYADAEQELVSILEKLQADVYRLEPYRIAKMIHNLRGLRRKQIAYVLGEVRPDLQEEIHAHMTEEYAAGEKWRSEAEDSLLRPRQYAEREGAAELEAQRDRLVALGHAVGGRTPSLEARVAFWSFFRSRPERWLRLLLSTGSRDLTIGNARRVLRELEIVGMASGMQPDALLRSWTESYKAIAPLDFQQRPSELPSRLDDSTAWQDWRKATIDAFDRVRRQPMNTEEQMAAMSPVGARRDIMFALEARPSEIHSMDDVVRGWMQPQYRGPLPPADPLLDKELVMGAYFEPSTPDQAERKIIRYMRDVRDDDDDDRTRRWIESMTKRLREYGILREEEDGRLVVDPDRIIAGREAMINDIAYAHNASLRMAAKPVSAKKGKASAKAREVLSRGAKRKRETVPAASISERDAKGRGARRTRSVAEPVKPVKPVLAKKGKASAKAREVLSRGAKRKRETVPAARISERDAKGRGARKTRVTPPPALTFSRPVTSQELTALNRTIHAGTLSLANYRAGYQALVESKAEVLARWNAKTKKELGPNAPSSVSKKEIVEALWKRWLGVFDILPVGDAHVFSMSQIRKPYDERVAEHVAGMTEAKIEKINAARIADNEARKAAADEEAAQLAEPKTLDDYRLLARRIGVSKMTAEQRLRMEELEAEASLDAAAARRGPRQIEVAASDLGWHVVPTWHFRQSVPTWTVRKETKGKDIPKDEFMRLATAARALSGKWERFTKKEGDKQALAGFLFFSEASAAKFRAALAGESVDNAEEVERRQQRADTNRAENLADLAERTRADAEDALGQDRKTNTAKRAREAASQEGRARGAIGFADSLERISDAISNGTAKFLRGVAHKTHVETLDRILRRAQSDIAQQVKQDLADGTKIATEDQHARYKDAYRDYPHSFPAVVVADVDGVKYPWPYFYAHVLAGIVRDVEGKAGCKLLAGRIKKLIARHSLRVKDASRETFTIDTKSEIEMLQDLAKCAPKSRIVEDLEDYNRVQAMGLTNLAMVKAALREYLGCCKGVAPKEDPIRAQERALIGRQYPGYFPTPRELADEVVARAGVRNGMRVLEPSAGKGSLVEAVLRAAPEAEVDVVEKQYDLRQILQAKGFNIIGSDIMEIEPVPTYDRIVANPPFEENVDIDHVMRMYELLLPGGRIVSIMGNGSLTNSGRKVVAFRQWLAERNGTHTKNEDGAFLSSDRPTGVASQTVVINKPAEAPGRVASPSKQRAKEKTREALAAGIKPRGQRPEAARVTERDKRGRGRRRAPKATRKFQPYFVEYARAMGREPEDLADGNQHAFAAWMGERWQEWRTMNGLPSKGALSDKQHEQFAAWLSGGRPGLAPGEPPGGLTVAQKARFDGQQAETLATLVRSRLDQEEQVRTRAAGRDDYLERKEARIDRLEGGAARAAGESEARYRRSGEGLPDQGEPVLVGHHSEKRHRAALARSHQNMRASIDAGKEAEELNRRADAARDNKAISSDDPEALERLKEKLEKLTTKRESFKAINKAIRARDPGAALAALGYKPTTVAKLIEGKGIADYELTNIGATVREVKRRIAELEGRAETAAPDPVERGNYLARWDSDSNRVVVEVPRSGDRTERERRSGILSDRGFKWTESLGYYQRLANDSAWHAAIAALAELAPDAAPIYTDAAMAEQAARAAKVASVTQARGPYSRRNPSQEDGNYFANLDYGRVSLYLPGGRGGKPPKLPAKSEKALRAAGFQIKYGQWRGENTDAMWRIACALVDAFADGGAVAAVTAAASGAVEPIGDDGHEREQAQAAREAWASFNAEQPVSREDAATMRGEGVEWRRGDYRAVHHVLPSKTPGVAIYAKKLPEGSDARKAREKAMAKADFRWSNVRRRWEPRPSRWIGSSDAEKWGAAVVLAQTLSGGARPADAEELAEGQKKFRRVRAQRAEKPGTPMARKKRLGRGNGTTVDSKLSDLLSDRAMVLGALATPATVEGAIQDIQRYLHPAGNDGYPGTSGFVAGWIKNMIATLMFEGKIELVSHRKFSGEVRSADMYQIRREMKLARAEAVEAARVMAERAEPDDDRAGARAELARKARWGGDYEWSPAPVPVRMRATAFGDPGSRVELKLAGFSERETGAGSTSGVVTRIQAERGRISVETDDGKTEWWRLVDVRLSSKKRAAAVAVARAAVAKGVSGHRRALPAAKGQRSGPRLPAERVTRAKAAARAKQKPAATYDGTEIVAYIKRGAIVARLLDANGKGVGKARGFDAATMATGKVIGIEAKHVLVRLQDRYGRDGDGTRERWPTQEVWPPDDAKYELERASGKTRAYKEKREDEVARKKRRAASKAKHLVHDMADYKGLGNKRTSKRATAKAGERRRKVAPVIRKAQADVRREQVRTRERAEMDAYMRDVAANTPPEFPVTQPPEGVRPGVRVALVDEDAGLGELSPTMRGVVQRIESAKGRAFVLADDGRAVFWPLSQMDTEATVVGEIKRAGERLASIGGNDFSLQRPASQVRAPMTGATEVQRAADAVAKAKSDKEEVENEVKSKPPTTKEGKARSKEKVKRAAKKLTEAEKALADKTKKAQQRRAARRCELEVEERSARKAVEAAERLGARLTAQHGAKLARLEGKRATCKKGCKISAKRLKATECKLLPTLKDIAGKLQDANAVRAKEMVKHAAAVAALAEMGVKVPPLSAAMPRQRSAGGAPPKRNCGTVCHIDLLGGLCGGQAAVVLPPRGTAAPFTVDTRFCLIEADRVISSHDPITFEPDQRYPSGVQERRYDRDKLEMSKVIGIAANPRPEIVINTSASPLDGTPIVTTEGFVLGGNGRSMGIRRNYINGGKEFSDYLVKNAAEFGFTAAQVRRFKQPMIVRVIDPPREEWSRYVRDLNQGLTQVMDAITESVSLARQMPQAALDALAEGLGDGEDLSTFFTQQASRGFVRALEAGGLITTQNRGRMLHPSGLLNEDGQSLAIRQLSAAVLPHADLLEFAGAETRKALARSAPYWLAAAAHGGDWDLRPSIELAMRDLIKAKAEQAADPGRFSLRKLFLQVDLFNPPQTKGHAFALRMLVLLAALADKPAVFAKLAKEFASDAAMFSGRTGTLLAPKTAMQSLEECAARVKIGKKPIDLAAEVADLDA